MKTASNYLEYGFKDMPKFDFLDKGLGIVSLACFAYDFSTKMFPCYIVLTNQISFSGCLTS